MPVDISNYTKDLIRLTQSVGQESFYANIHNLLQRCFDYDELLVLRMKKQSAVELEYRYGKDGVENRLQGEGSWKYLTRLYVLDPFYRVFADNNQFGFYTLSEIAPEEFENIYNSYFNYLELADEIGYLFDIGDDTCLHIDLSRFGENAEFEPKVLSFLAGIFESIDYLVKQHHKQLANEATNSGSEVEYVLEKFGLDVLTKKEYETCQLLLQGYSAKSIAERMDIGYETVKMHKKNIYSKCHISSQAELLALFIDILQQESLDPEIDHLAKHLEH